VLSIAIPLYRCKVVTAHPFADNVVLSGLAKEAWAEACEKTEIFVEPNVTVLKMVRHTLMVFAVFPPPAQLAGRASHVRGELKTKVRPLVAAMYGFDSGIHKKSVCKNCQLAESLKEKYGFVYKVGMKSYENIVR
jgi:hypothetical protein